MTNPVNLSENFGFRSPVSLRFGNGLIDGLSDLCPDAKKVFLVTGQGSAMKNGLAERAAAALPNADVELFSGVEPNPSIETVEAGAARAAEIGADLVIGLGGGSAMDAAKVMAVLATNRDGFRANFQKPEFPVPPLPVIAIPTTCGTGSEANKYAIITDKQNDDKVNFSNNYTYPVIGLLDPSVLAEMPENIMVSTAFDAFSHAFEGYISRRNSPVTDTIAIEAMGLLIESLPAAVSGDMAARGNLLYASSLAGIVIDHTGTTVLHALGYYLTLVHDVPHGLANALLLPLLFDYLDGICAERIAKVYRLFPEGERGGAGLTQYLLRAGVDPAELGRILPAGEFERIIRYTLGKKNTPLTPGKIDEAVLRHLLETHAK